ncbi:MAG TPA: amidase [Xanthobacteraceae bacterium]|jgi:aspartyl-tRNA(Asn)/glutamyl-tRNA(Gln) amidotransferase subunit A
MNEPAAWGLEEAAAHIRRREISSVEYAQALLARIDRLEPKLQAWARVEREALLREAATCDAEAHRSVWRGPLHGVAVGIKDNFETEAIETCAGSAILAGNRPRRDADAVARLRAAGALVLGKTAMTAFAAMDPAPTRNPWNPAHTPGGSSSGSAAAVAARMCPAALGSQTAGSVLRPAAYCGVVGLKPTYGTVSRRGLIPCAWSMDHAGAIIRSCADAEALLGILSVDARAARQADEASVTIGVPDRSFLETADAEAQASFQQALALLTGAGCRIVALALPPGFEALVEAGVITMYAEMAAYHRDRYARHAAAFPPRLSTLIEAGLRIGAADYLRAQQIRRLETSALSRLLEQVTVLITPATPAPAPAGLDSTGDWRFNLPFSFSGHPAISIPCGISRAGLPLGLQMVAAHFREDRLFRVGRLFQKLSDWHRASPAAASSGAFSS